MKEARFATPSPLQRGLLAESELAEVSGVNIEQVVCDIGQRLAFESFREAWRGAIREFDALRMSFERGDHSAFEARFHASADPEHTLIDWSSKPSADREQAFQRHLEEDRQRGFEPGQVPLRLRSIVLGPERWRLLWTFHHSILDGYSYVIVLKRVFEIYEALRSGKEVEHRRQASYEAYLEWLAKRDHTVGESFFADLLDGFSEPTPLPFSDKEPPSGLGGAVSCLLGSEETEELHRCARSLGVTRNTVVQLCWGVLLSRYSNSKDVVFGAAWSGRDEAYGGSEELVGVVMNTTPIRLTLDPPCSVREALEALRSQHLRAKDLARTPLPLIQERSSVRGDRPLFSSVVVFDAEGLGARVERSYGPCLAGSFRLHSATGTPLTLAVHSEEAGLAIELEYRGSVVTEREAATILNQYRQLLRSVIRDPDARVTRLRMLDDQDFGCLVEEQVARELSRVSTDIVETIDKQASEHPNDTALVSPSGAVLSYAELERDSHAVAAELRRRGAKVVALLMERSNEVVIAMLGALRAGVPFVPVDPGYPDDRIDYLLRDCGAPLVLTSQSVLSRLPQPSATIVNIERILDERQPTSQSFAEDSDARGSRSDPDAVAYVIYTSGSTGEPKGVCIPRAALANHCAAIREEFELRRSDRVLQFASLSFDVALEEIFPTLVAGATLVSRSDAAASSIGDFFDFVNAQNITVANLPTAFWHMLVHHKESSAWPVAMRLLVVGGEKASKAAHSKFRSQDTSHIRWLNGYGPTETTITSTVYDDAEEDHETAIPIGKPISSVSHFVLDDDMQPLPRGAVGQLFIGGAGLATGYLGRPEVTAAAFVDHPFREGGRLYATGDRVALSDRGNFVYLERLDLQVKVRGYRIEPGEIEAQLLALPGVTDAAVIPSSRTGGDTQLFAHIVLSGDAVSPVIVRDQLTSRLPSYMVPAHFKLHETLPRSPSGKIDRGLLLQLSEQPRRASTTSIEPASPMERELREIWEELLEQSGFDDDTNFFDLGGSSLLALQLFSEVHRRLRSQINPRSFFLEPTFRNMLQVVEPARAAPGATFVTTLAKGDGTILPLFLTPGVTGSAATYVGIASGMNEAIPFLALEVDQMGGDPKTALREYARTCVDQITEIQKEGPYALLGYSAGGVAALAIAEALLERGHAVDFFGIIDGVPPDSLTRHSPFTGWPRFLRFARTAAARSQDYLRESGARGLAKRAGAIGLRAIAVWGRGDAADKFDVGELVAAGVELTTEARSKWETNLAAFSGFQHRKLPIDITLLRSALDPFEGPHSPDLDWGRVVSGEVLVEIVARRHLDFMLEEGVASLCQYLNRHLLRRKRSPAGLPRQMIQSA
jgi:amino acid adenylation domain-containing protein